MKFSANLHKRFPPDFRFGAATAAYQIEGAVHEDGRKPSIWDAFSNTPGRVANGDTGEHACDHYHRMESDLDLARDLGLDAYRFSIAWPRVVPDGRGPVNAKGLDFYERVVDGCLERGLEPCATLYHWDLPLSLGDAGGWCARMTAEAFADYAAIVARRLGDRINAVSTFNEPWCSALLGHLYGIHAPGDTDLDKALVAVHNQHLAHGLAVQAVRAERPTLSLGIVLNLQTIYPLSDDDSDREAAVRHRCFHNDMFTGPLFEGAYPEALIDALGDRLPPAWQADLTTIHQPLDWWGLNWYTPMRVTGDAQSTEPFPGTRSVVPEHAERTDIGWEIAPSALCELLLELDSSLQLPPCWITENGACVNVVADAAGLVNDTTRVTYLDDHLGAVADAIDGGCDIRGYFAWSLMDNFEWAEGYTMRFGIVHVDYDTQVRTPKSSAKAYSAMIRAHRDNRQ